MSEDIIDPWEDAVPVTEYTGIDFSGRHDSVSAYDTSGWCQGAADAVRTAMDADYSRSEAVDRVLRYYIGAVLDETGDVDAREQADTAVQVPPAGWVDAHDVRMDIAVEPSDTDPLFVSTHEAVATLVHHCMTEHTDVEKTTDFIEAALRWFVGDEPLMTHVTVGL